jgi:hypothetical protein
MSTFLAAPMAKWSSYEKLDPGGCLVDEAPEYQGYWQRRPARRCVHTLKTENLDGLLAKNQGEVTSPGFSES